MASSKLLALTLVMYINLALAVATNKDLMATKSTATDEAAKALEQKEKAHTYIPMFVYFGDFLRRDDGAGSYLSAPLLEKSPGERTADLTQNTTTTLDGGFVTLFDELFRFKNASRNALLSLNYFNRGSKEKNMTQSSNTPATPTTTISTKRSNAAIKVTESPELKDNATEAIIKSVSTSSSRTKTNPLTRTTKRPEQRTPAGAPRQPNQQALGHFFSLSTPSWLMQIHVSVNKLLAIMTNRRTSSANVLSASPAQSKAEEKPENSTGRLLPEGTTKRIRKRELNETESKLATTTQTTESDLPAKCIEVEVSQMNKCHATEAFVGENLGNSFPGTFAAIEDNCHHISFLLANCWPQRLQMIKASLHSWNESTLATTDFPIPTEQQVDSTKSKPDTSNQTSALMKGTSCGVQPKLGEMMLERVTWMWLNLCMDKKFRHDYLENLRCLGLWSHDRAQQACTNEYRRMQTNVNTTGISSANKVSGRLKNGQSSASDSKKQAIESSDLKVSASTNSTPPEVVDRELESKVLCCLFDVFLRCVHKQAVRDCGRNGGQFVVSFMARIGKDDMKFLCNSEPRSLVAQRAKPSNPNNRKGLPGLEKGPFIEYNYCIDPRINAYLHSSNEKSQDDTGIQRTQGNKNKNGTKLFDPNKDIGEFVTDSSVPVSFSTTCYLLAWILTFCISIFGSHLSFVVTL